MHYCLPKYPKANAMKFALFDACGTLGPQPSCSAALPSLSATTGRRQAPKRSSLAS